MAAASSVWGNDGSATLTVNGNVDASLAPLTLAGAGNSVYNGIISGSGTSITKVDAGTVTLNGANTYTGVTAITDGRAQHLRRQQPRHGARYPHGGEPALEWRYAGDYVHLHAGRQSRHRGGDGAAGSAGTIDVASDQTLTYNGIIANNGANDQLLAKSGDGTLALGGVSTFSGGTLISAGTIRVDNASALGGAGAVSLVPTGGTSANLLVNVAGSFDSAGDGGHPERHGNGDGHGGLVRGPERRGDVRRRSCN